VVSLQGPNTTVGDIGLWAGGVQTFDAVAVTPLELGVMTARQFHELRGRYSEINEALLERWAAIILRAVDHISNAVLMNLEERIICLLKCAADYYGEKALDRTPIVIPLSQEQIGNILGVTRQSVNRALKGLKSQHQLYMGKQGIVLRTNAIPAGANL